MPSVFELVPRSLRASDAPAGDSIDEHLRSVRSTLGEAGAARHEIGARIAVEIGHGIAPRAANAERPEQLGALEEGAPRKAPRERCRSLVRGCERLPSSIHAVTKRP